MIQNILLLNLMLLWDIFLISLSVKMKKNERKVNVIEGFKLQIDASEFVILRNRPYIKTFILKLHKYFAYNVAGGNGSTAPRDGFQNKFCDYEDQET